MNKKGMILENINTSICMAIGMASMCWEEIPKGTFKDARAKEIADMLMRDVEWQFRELLNALPEEE